MELRVWKEEYQEIEVTKFGSDMQTTIKLLNLDVEVDVQPYQLLKDILGEMSKFYGEDELQDIAQEIIHGWF